MNKINQLITETSHPKSIHLDEMSINEILQLMNEEDQYIPRVIASVLTEIEAAVEAVHHAFNQGGRLFYVGAGTSGRIGLLDAVECPPTFGTSQDMVQAVMAGGDKALVHAIEGAEDNLELGKKDLENRSLTEKDVVIGIAASGRTPYVKGALMYANEVNATTISLTSNKDADISDYAQIKIEAETGPEILTGSTRLKAATAHKMILNMISTASMIKQGKVYKNLMVDVHATNYKLRERAKTIVQEATNVTYEEAETVLIETDFAVKPAIVMLLAGVDYDEAKAALHNNSGYVKEAIKDLTKN